MRAITLRTLLLLVTMAIASTLFSQSAGIKVTGKVTNVSDNTPLPFVTVTIKGNTSTAATTNEQGNYSITVPSESSVLVFSFVGFMNQEEVVGNRRIINVSLLSNQVTLDEVVVVGYGNKKSPQLTGSVSSVRIRGASTLKKGQKNKNVNAEYSGNYDLGALYDNKYNKIYIPNAEEYGTFTENKFQIAQEVPLSTFSIDVDAASYSNMRRYINQGQIPPRDAIRTEELINYFNYDYPQPQGKHPINVITEIADCPWNNQNRLLHIGIKAKEIPIEDLPGSNLVFLIDVSGSMSSSNKLPLVKSSMKMLVKQLRDIDRVAIVTYAGSAGVNMESTSGKEKDKINNAIDKLRASGSTAGGEGIMLAYKIAKENFIKNGNNRVILASDGDFNVGVSSNEGLEQLIEKERKSGVFLTVLGYGMGNYKDSKMQTLAQKGNGNHAYIDNFTEAQKVLVNEFGGTLFTIAKDVKLQLEFNPAKVQAYRLIGYESRLLNKEDFNDDTKDAGEMGTGHTVTALYEIIPFGVKSNIIGSVDELKYQKPLPKPDVLINNSNETLTVKIRYKQPDGDTSERLDIPVIDSKRKLSASSDNFRFSAAVAQIGMLLHDSPYKSNANYDNAIKLAKKAYGEDKNGYRHEFVKLAENLQLMSEAKQD